MGSTCFIQSPEQSELRHTDVTLDKLNTLTNNSYISLNDSLSINQLRKESHNYQQIYKYGPIYRKIVHRRKELNHF